MDRVLQNFAGRVGMTDESSIRKAGEFLRIYRSKNAIKNLSDVAKSLLCLDIAATNLGVAFDQLPAIKLSGLKKRHYFNQLHTLEKLLQVDKILTIQELCVQLGCTSAIEYAESILNEYKKKHQVRDDFEHPQYTAAAVYTACSVKNLKVEKSRLFTASQLKSAQWKELTTSFMKSIENFDVTENKDIKNKRELCVMLEDVSKKTDNMVSPSKKNCADDEKIESYEEWRERILEESYQALRNK